jgi:2-dehydro-3-deoxyglucarate aldolase
MAERLTLKAKLASTDLALGGWIMIGHPAVAEIMARAGFDWVAVDMEHSAMTTQQAEDLIRAIETGGKPALVRLTNNDEHLIKRVMDSGATGVIVPLVRTAEDARQAVDALYYPPKGRRGVGLARAQKYGAGFMSYREWLDREAVCIVQIEHIEAIKNCEAILSVPNVDGYLLGPYDISASMGLAGQLEHPNVIGAIATVRKTAKKMEKSGGIHIVEPDEVKLRQAIEQGFNFIAYSIDTRIIDTVCRAGIKAAKGSMP